jgi:Domain of unknown function (DUF4333)
MRKWISVAAVVATSAGLIACGDEVLDTGQLEDEITSDSNESLQGAGTDITVESVSCPDDIKSETGEPFECEIAWSDDTGGTVSGEVTDGDAGDVEYNITP